MEQDIAELLVSMLTASAGFTDVVGDKLYPLVADEGVAEPFAVYRIDEANGASKDGAETFSVSVVLVFEPKGYLRALNLKNVVKAVLDSAESPFIYQFSDTGFDDDTQRVISFINYEITGSPA